MFITEEKLFALKCNPKSKYYGKSMAFIFCQELVVNTQGKTVDIDFGVFINASQGEYRFVMMPDLSILIVKQINEKIDLKVYDDFKCLFNT
ncbi:hypothetical protein [Snodgrassella sp. CFCC 13594]|uniref:hypothetical protein n=1 Tax=Snodgrassella sp. CFCC 13594 TaxID=1775559 RepID=UPI00082D4CDD|nr:hypothetical protein [Snodgrassella sp. CFCC 13594]